MIKRLLLVLTIAGGVVMVPYLLLPPEPEYLYPTGYIFITYSSIVKYFITYFVLCYLIGEHKKLFNYIRYGSFVLLLFLGLGVKGQTLTGVRFNMGNTLDTTYMKGDTLTQVWDSTGRNCYQDLEKGTTNTMCTLTHWQITEVFYIHTRLELLSRKIKLKPLYK